MKVISNYSDQLIMPVPSIALLAIASMTFATNLHASLLAYEGFDGYTDGAALESQTIDAGFGWAQDGWTSAEDAAALATVDAGLSYGELSVSGGSASNVVSGDRVGYYRQVDFSSYTPVAGGELWLSALVDNVSGTKSWGITLDDGNDNQQGIGFGSANFISGTAASIQANYGGYVTNGSGESFSGTTFYVLRLTYNELAVDSNPTVDLWVNPDLNTDLSATAVGGGDSTASSSYGGVDEISNLVIYTHQDNATIFDEIRVGTTMSDVMVIPEPSAYALISGLVLFGLAAMRRRQ